MWTLVVGPQSTLPEPKPSRRFRWRSRPDSPSVACPPPIQSAYDDGFWADMPSRRWLLNRVGWPSESPRHSAAHDGWRLQVLLSMLMCATLAVSLFLIH